MIEYVLVHRVTNVVCTFGLGVTDLSLNELVHEYNFITYNPSKFAAGIIRNKTSRTSYLLFCTGAAVCMGAKMVETARYGSQMLCNYFLSPKFPFVMSDFRVRNVVGTM